MMTEWFWWGHQSYFIVILTELLVDGAMIRTFYRRRCRIQVYREIHLNLVNAVLTGVNCCDTGCVLGPFHVIFHLPQQGFMSARTPLYFHNFGEYQICVFVLLLPVMPMSVFITGVNLPLIQGYYSLSAHLCLMICRLLNSAKKGFCFRFIEIILGTLPHDFAGTA